MRLAAGTIGFQALLMAAEVAPANALLTYYVYEDSGDVVVETRGSVDLTNATPASGPPRYCYFGNGVPANSGYATSNSLLLCTGLDVSSPNYLLSGTSLATINNTQPGVSTGPTGQFTGIGTYFGLNFG